MKISAWIGSVMAGVLFVGPLWAETESSVPLTAQKFEETPKAEEIQGADATEYAYGTVKEIMPGKMVVSEDNDETGLSSDISYAIDPSVLLENVDTLGEIAVGDSVDFEYVLKDGSKVITLVSVERLLPGEEADAAGLAY